MEQRRRVRHEKMRKLWRSKIDGLLVPATEYLLACSETLQNKDDVIVSRPNEKCEKGFEGSP